MFTELANTMKHGGGGIIGLYTFFNSELPFKTVPGDVTALHKIVTAEPQQQD